MNGHDDKLKALLRQWRDIEPPAHFEADVRRRIRLAQTDEPERISLAEALQRLLWRPALAAAIVASIIIGSSAGILTARAPAESGANELQFFSAGTLAGGYLQASAGRTR